jgi:hypothetical protein
VKRAARGLVAIGAVAGVWLACSLAGQYLANLDCVTPGLAVDVIDGPPVDASCDATCVVEPFDGGVYITGQCAPFPLGDMVNPDAAPFAALCAKGLAAIHRSDLCLDAGPSNPLVDSGAPRTDAGAGDAGAHDAESDGARG